VTVHVVTRAEQRAVVGSDYYYGGILVDDNGGLHTAKYHRAPCANSRAGAAQAAFACGGRTN